MKMSFLKRAVSLPVSKEQLYILKRGNRTMAVISLARSYLLSYVAKIKRIALIMKHVL